ncbi:uncharacterized protein SRS1_10060 [Sporisorium reilianum f. sp. reilianum]|uniref:Uncharacterized protein n=1 Tax=Sporisorium reilianum f. sp. reilianum TaxID=72559 RepID=A0A2N8UMJ5_9BASI|nr:uncharacterized protein SRS1_10060 [Sporisorium reilianum f. sp. reilianum]
MKGLATIFVQSQVKEALRLIDDENYREVTGETLAKRLYPLSTLEGDPNRPHAIHHQLQSQAFYRMMIDRYFKVHSYPERGFRESQAYETFDKLIDEYWSSYKGEYVQKYKGREHATRETKKYDAEKFLQNIYPELPENDLLGGRFKSGYAELPDDKKAATEYLRTETRAKAFDRHLNSVWDIAVRKHIFPLMFSGSTDDLRRFSNVEATSSRRPTVD